MLSAIVHDCKMTAPVSTDCSAMAVVTSYKPQPVVDSMKVYATNAHSWAVIMLTCTGRQTKGFMTTWLYRYVIVIFIHARFFVIALLHFKVDVLLWVVLCVCVFTKNTDFYDTSTQGTKGLEKKHYSWKNPMESWKKLQYVEKLHFSWSEVPNVHILNFHSPMYPKSFGRKAKGWLLRASIRFNPKRVITKDHYDPFGFDMY